MVQNPVDLFPVFETSVVTQFVDNKLQNDKRRSQGKR
jgi:hypothetical protein